jgi:hypothetical protein
MTLVVARRDGDAIITVADTKLFPELDQRWTLSSQANKIICLDERWLLAYAGNAYWVDKTLRAIKLTTIRFEFIRDLLSRMNIDSRANGSEAEFILINTITLQMYKFSSGRFDRVHTNATWLGSKNAFEKYQQLHDLASKSPPSNELPSYGEGGMAISPEVIDEKRERLHSRITKIFKFLMEDSTIPEVGGFTISAIIHGGTVRFWPRSAGLLSVPPGGLPPEHLRDSFFGDAAYGDFQYDIATSWNPTDNVVAVIFRAIRKALVFRQWDDALPYAKIVDEISDQTPTEDLKKLLNCQLWSIELKRNGHVVTINADPPKAA